PDAAQRTTLVPRLAQTARAATLEAEGQATRRAGRPAPRGSRLGRLAQVCAAVAAIPLVLAGPAFAGVTVPGPPRGALDSVGITLPNQPSHHGHKATNPSSKTTGNEVSGAARSASHHAAGGNSAAAHRHALRQRAKAHGKAIGHAKGKAIGLTGATP